jgi:hypothetical protein
MTWGLGQDARVMEQVLREACIGGGIRIESIDHIDPTVFYGSARKPRSVDVQIHLEVPCRAAWPWARYNVVMVNQEWWYDGAWDWVAAAPDKGGADLFLFKSAHARSLFPAVEGRRCRVIPWRCSPEINGAISHLDRSPGRREFLYLIGASANKTAAAHAIVGAWRSSWPPIRIVGVLPVLEELRAAYPGAAERGVTFQLPFPKDSDRIEAQREFAYHVVASAAEGFGYTFAEATAVGALPLWTEIPVYKEYYGDLLGSVGLIKKSSEGAKEKGLDPLIKTWTAADVVTAVESLLSLSAEDEHRLRGALRHLYTTQVKTFRHACKSMVGGILTRLRTSSAPRFTLPPRLPAIADLPHVAVITITRNRPKWFANMARNILLADYPPDKLTWVIADDGDAHVAAGSTGGRVDEAVARFSAANPRISVKYLSFPTVLPVGEKRNRACEAAPAAASVFVMMDDDDHYPAKSVAARVAWLTTTGAGCVYCSTLPMYDCKRYISAVNVPPLDLSPAERVSEASLAFTREFWSRGKFPAAVSVAEGEGFLESRVEETIEIPPEGIIVSFLHGANATSRRVPAASEPNGCHYGFDDDYFAYISGLAI